MGRARVAFLAVALGWASAAQPAEARLKRDIVPNAEAAKAIAKLAVMGFEGEDAFQGKRRGADFISVKLIDDVWEVRFTPWNPLAPAAVAGPGEVIVSTDCGFCVRVRISKNDAKVRSVRFER